MPSGLRRGLARFELNLAALLMFALLVTLGLQVLTRYVFNDPLSWTEEVARYLYVYIVFLGASAAISDRSHVALGFFATKLPRPLHYALAVLLNILIVAFLALLAYWGWRAAKGQATLNLMTIDIPYFWVYIVVPITAVLMILRTLWVMREDHAAFGRGEALAAAKEGAL